VKELIQSMIYSNFIDTAKTQPAYPPKFEFNPHISNGSPSKSLSESIYGFFTTPRKFSSRVEHLDEKITNEINNIINSPLEGKSLFKEKKEFIFKLLKEKKYRKYFLNSLNSLRTKGLFTLDEISFNSLGEIFNFMLNEIASDNDYFSFNNWLILSQTYYKKIDITQSPQSPEKVYLQSCVGKHKVTANIEFWEELIRFSINEEFNSQTEMPIYSKENLSEIKVRCHNIVFGKLSYYLINIPTFGIEFNKVNELIEKFHKFYDLPHNLVEILKMTISMDDYKLK